jgi:hypothetical protein
MRVAFGLVSLLVVLAIILLVFNFYSAPMLKQGKTTRDEARQIAGRDENNAPVTDAVVLSEQDRNGQMEAAVVADIAPGSTLQTHYGLKKGDVILVMGQLTVKGNMSSAEEAKDYLLYAYQRSEPVVVVRGGMKVTLPVGPAAGNPAAPVLGSGAPAPDAPQAAADDQSRRAKPERKTGIEGQLDLIRNRPDQQQ